MGLKNEPHRLKYYAVPPANEAKFSSDLPPDLPKIISSSPLPMVGTLSLLVNPCNGALPSCEPESVHVVCYR